MQKIGLLYISYEVDIAAQSMSSAVRDLLN